MVKVALVCYVPTEEWSFIYHKDISEDELKNLKAQETVNSADYDEEWFRAGATLFTEGWGEPDVWVHKIDTNYEDDSLIISSGDEIEEDDGEEKEGTDDSEDEYEDEEEDGSDEEDDDEEGDEEGEGGSDEEEEGDEDEESELSVSGQDSEESS